MSDLSLLPIGRIRKAHGIRGEVSVEYHADSPDLFYDGVYLRIGQGKPVLYKATSCRVHHGALLVLFENVPDRNAAENLRGSEVLVPVDRLPEPDDGTIYLHEILGLSVVAVSDDGTETDWGVISSVADPAGQELWTIAKDHEADVLFPATPELVLGFDLDRGIVRIAPPAGLLALYRP